MTSKAYLAISCSKALPLSIVHRLVSPIFVKEPARNLHKWLMLFFHTQSHGMVFYLNFCHLALNIYPWNDNVWMAGLGFNCEHFHSKFQVQYAAAFQDFMFCILRLVPCIVQSLKLGTKMYAAVCCIYFFINLHFLKKMFTKR